MEVEKWMKGDVVTVRPGDDLLKAERLMLAYQIRHLPVLDEAGRLCGILSDRDIRDHSPPPELGGRPAPARQQVLRGMPVERAMTRAVVTVAVDAPMERAVRLMKTRRIDSLPVLRDGELVGIITSANLLNFINDFLGMEPGSVKLEVELSPAQSEVVRLMEVMQRLRVPVSGITGRLHPGEGRVHLSLMLHKSRLAEAERELEAAGIAVREARSISE